MKVVFYVDNVAVAETTIAPYALTWDTTALSGSHVLHAVAYDAAGNAGSSGNVTVTVSNGSTTATDTTAPVVSIGTLVKNGNSMTVIVSASDNVGVTHVDLYVDGSRVAVGTTAPYTFRVKVQQFSPGQHTVSAKGYDAAGNVGVSPGMTFTR